MLRAKGRACPSGRTSLDLSSALENLRSRRDFAVLNPFHCFQPAAAGKIFLRGRADRLRQIAVLNPCLRALPLQAVETWRPGCGCGHLVDTIRHTTAFVAFSQLPAGRLVLNCNAKSPKPIRRPGQKDAGPGKSHCQLRPGSRPYTFSRLEKVAMYTLRWPLWGGQIWQKLPMLSRALICSEFHTHS